MERISATDLVLNTDQSVYHLGLHPEELAEVVFLVGDPGRVPQVSRHFDQVEVTKQKREFVTHTGTIGNRRFSVVSTGIGPDNIDIVLNELDALVNIDLKTRTVREERTSLQLIRLGTSGGLHPEVQVGDLVLSRYAIGLDNLLHFYKYHPKLPEAELLDALEEFQMVHGRLPVVPYAFAADHALFEMLAEDAGLKPGITITCPGFYGPQGRKVRLQSRISHQVLENLSVLAYRGFQVTNFEMESSAIFGLASILGHRAVSCCAILANRRLQQFSDRPQEVVDGLIQQVLARFSQ